MSCAWSSVTATEVKGVGIYKEPSPAQGLGGCVRCLGAGCPRRALCGVCPQDGPGHQEAPAGTGAEALRAPGRGQC